MTKADGYRVTFDVAAMDIPSAQPPSAACSGAACYRDAPPAPPPPPQPADPVLAYVLATDHACYDAALRKGSPTSDATAYRELALDYVRARQGVARCVDHLLRVSAQLPRDATDGRAFEVHRDALIDGYRATDRDVIAVLVAALDAGTAGDERATSF